MTEHEQLTQAMKDSQAQPPPPAGLSEQQELQVVLDESRRSSSEELQVKMPAVNNTTLVRVNTAPADAGTDGNGEDKTPVLIASTRSYISKTRAKNRATMSKKLRKRSAKCVMSLSRPRDNAYVNELKSVAEKPTPERSEHLMDLAEDMEED